MGQEKFKAAEFVRSLANDREGQCEVKVFDEGGHGAGVFLAEFEVDSLHRQSSQTKSLSQTLPSLYRLSDSSGSAAFEPVKPAILSSLSSSDAFLLDHGQSSTHPAIYVWIGKNASLTESRLAMQYAQIYAHQQGEYIKASISLVKMNEGNESDTFIHAFDG